MNLLITGATGYVGGRLVPRLLEDGHSLRCLVRDPERLKGRPWLDKVEVFKGDVLKSDDLDQVMLGIDTAYYLIHSLGGGDGYAERDLQAARAFAQAAKTAGVKRIIYLGGLAKEDRELSEHLRSRQATGDALREAGVPVTEFRAGVVVGSGSLSFEMIRYLTERVPVMVCPSWVYTPAQPVGIRDVLEYLAAALSREESLGRIIEIGGADVVTYGTMMTAYAEARGLKRRMLPVPFLTPRLSSYWVHLVTPIPSAIARPLILGLKNENKVTDFSALEIFPDITPSTYQVALNRALARLDAGAVETRWTDAAGDAFPHVVLESREGLILEHRRRPVRAAPEKVFSIFSGIGGERGWFFMNSAWRLRGALDRMIGGVGLRRGRRDPDQLRVGDALDFWRVEAVEPGHLIRLRAEMKVPGKAWLEFQVEPRDSEPGSILTQTAFFAPKGLWGLMYWYALYPLHGIIFSGLIRQIVRRAEQRAEQNE
ncbi:MAG: SDR family oxidoreductase [Verrucomicrobia bacterium]|nr:SDR family oxidoreductase [Verrucomicrobiota bacterium]MCH8526217.1 SDR family oxidoreductase [Kiritimatiellia bacterium]